MTGALYPAPGAARHKEPGHPGGAAGARPHRAADPRAALNAAQSSHAALLRRQKAAADLLDARKQAATAAQQSVEADTARTQSLRAQTAVADHKLSSTESQVTGLQAEIGTLSRQQDSLREDIAAREAALRPVLPLAERLSLAPAATLIASPQSPERAVEGLAILGGVATLTEREADQIRDRQRILAGNAVVLQDKRAALDKLVQTQRTERDEAARQTQIARRVENHARTAADSARAAVSRAAAEATDLQDAVTKIEQAEAAAQAALAAQAQAMQRQHRERQAANIRRQAADIGASAGRGVAAGGGAAPVAGTVTVNWGAETESGPATGMSYRAAGGAPVRAPCTGRVDFAGEFRSFGQMVILDCGKHYRFVLAGMGILSVSGGKAVSKGSTMGTMSPSGGTLFVQLRSGGVAVDPRPFL